MANIITLGRMIISAVLLFCPVFSPAFYALYITAGLTDIADGAVARRTGAAGGFGSRLDTAADTVFAAACLIKLLPVMRVPIWLYIWIAAIAIIKTTNIAAGYIRQKKFVSVHSALNKAAGALLFVFPLTWGFTDIAYGAAAVCAVATVAAVHEGYLIRSEKTV